MGKSSRADPEEGREGQEEGQEEGDNAEGGEEEEETVSSECQPMPALVGSGADESGTHTWRIACTPAWAISSPASSEDDEEGVKRKRRRRETLSLSLQYRRQTPISDCGQQVRGPHSIFPREMREKILVRTHLRVLWRSSERSCGLPPLPFRPTPGSLPRST